MIGSLKARLVVIQASHIMMFFDFCLIFMIMGQARSKAKPNFANCAGIISYAYT